GGPVVIVASGVVATGGAVVWSLFGDDSVKVEGEKYPVIVRRVLVEVRRKNRGKEEGERGGSWRGGFRERGEGGRVTASSGGVETCRKLWRLWFNGTSTEKMREWESGGVRRDAVGRRRNSEGKGRLGLPEKRRKGKRRKVREKGRLSGGVVVWLELMEIMVVAGGNWAAAAWLAGEEEDDWKRGCSDGVFGREERESGAANERKIGSRRRRRRGREGAAAGI
ncbi:hypothetical protein HAX54_000216, partial [Datura stramonium]|nr:hypothetical protein [Datura stramonium]